MTAPDALALPEALTEVAAIGFEWHWDPETDAAHGYDFELDTTLEPPAVTAEWFRLWTGNPDVDGSEFRFFGTTGAGDYVGFWLVRPDAALVEQPVLLLGSEGECGVVARDLGDLLWLLASGLGPLEALEHPDRELEENPAFRRLAERHAPGRERPARAIVESAGHGLPDLAAYVEAQCR